MFYNDEHKLRVSSVKCNEHFSLLKALISYSSTKLFVRRGDYSPTNRETHGDT